MLLHHPYRRRRRGERGASLTMVLLLSTLSILIVNTLANTAVVMVRLANRSQNRAVALTLAEAGIDHAVDQLRLNEAYTGGTVTIYENPPTNTRALGTFTTTITNVDSKNKQVRSVGTMPNGTTREIAAWVSNVPTNDLFKYAIAAKTTMTLSSNLTVGSYPEAGTGDIHSNGTGNGTALSSWVYSIDANGGMINGRVTSSGLINGLSKMSATGGYATSQPAVNFPTLDAAALKAQAQTKGTSTTVTYTGGAVTLRGLYTGDVNISGNTMVTIDSPVYVMGNVSVTGGQTVTFGDGALICEKGIKINGNGSFALLGTKGFSFVSTMSDPYSAAITVGGNATITAGLFALNGIADVNGNISILGTLAANKVITSGGVTINRNTDFDPPAAIGGKMQVNRWQEL